MVQHADPVESCASCPAGQAAGVRHGGRCPLVDRKYEPHAVLYAEGEGVHHVWFVKRGAVLLSRETEGPRALRGPGSFLGLEALIGPSYRDTARIERRAILCGVPCGGFASWLGSAGLPARMVLEQVLRAEGVERVRGAGADGTAVQRVARWLLDADALELELPRDKVAGLLGMVPETLSRVIGRLRADGAITATRRSLAIRDRAALERATR